MNTIIKDLQPTYFPVVYQFIKYDGQKYDLTGTPTVTIYEEDGTDSSFGSTEVTGSPFTIAKLNSKTGLYGVMVAKSLFTTGYFYRFLWEATINGVDTAGQEIYFACDSSSFKSYSGGAYRKVYTVTDGDGIALEGVEVRATSDAAGNTTIATSETDSNGEAILYLPAGTVYLWNYKQNYSFSNPDVEVVE